VTLKKIYEVQGAHDEMDSVSLLQFISESEFQLRPTWLFKEVLHPKTGHIIKFICTIEFNKQKICDGQGQNKKEAKSHAAKAALRIVAPVMFEQKYQGESALVDEVIPDDAKHLLAEIAADSQSATQTDKI